MNWESGNMGKAKGLKTLNQFGNWSVEMNWDFYKPNNDHIFIFYTRRREDALYCSSGRFVADGDRGGYKITF